MNLHVVTKSCIKLIILTQTIKYHPTSIFTDKIGSFTDSFWQGIKYKLIFEPVYNSNN